MTTPKQIYKEMKKLDDEIEKLKKQRPKNLTEKHYICPSCGELSTFSQQLEACLNGGMPYCYCKFGGKEGRIFVGYKRINKKLWEELKKLKTNKLRIEKYVEGKFEKRKLRK